ncbi:MAG: hypothetical protein JRH17_04980 [Deltaproteobacteria bacterium]|nr:hypothetical protein [Deltaproteobacteria bacterium]MBW2697634.1 hypothetical protein [Deltaproteobacteria bacterium]
MSANGHDPDDYRIPPHQMATWLLLGLTVVLLGALFGVRLEHQPETTRDYPRRPLIADGPVVLLPGPEMNDEYLPCSDCHEDEPTNRTPRELEDDHEDKQLAHGDLWCLQCHDTDDRDALHLADGTLVTFEDSWQLCTQCHGKKLADWRAGVHGKRTGHWRGRKEYRTCVACHNPHSPPFKPLAPKPRPRRPEEIGGQASVSLTAGEEHHDDS